MHIRVDQYIPVCRPLDGKDWNAGCLRQPGRVRRRHTRVPVALHDRDGNRAGDVARPGLGIQVAERLPGPQPPRWVKQLDEQSAGKAVIRKEPCRRGEQVGR